MDTRHRFVCLCLVILPGISPDVAAIDPATGPRYVGHASADFDQWQRIDFRSERLAVRTAPQIKVAIQTRGPAMHGLIRIPGAPASNFDTGKWLTVVDLINVGDEIEGYSEIVALEIVLTQTTPGQILPSLPRRTRRRQLGHLAMIVTNVQDQAIAARMALIVGADRFDRLFQAVRFDEVDGDILYVYARDEDTAAEMEDEFALHISIIASKILDRQINVVLVLPRQLMKSGH